MNDNKKATIMKKAIRISILVLFLLASPILISNSFSQGEPPLPGGSPVDGPGGPVGTSAPIDGGLSIFLLLGAFYSTYKYKKGNKFK